jgi:broad specificity phosphatase PhoE
VILYLVRHGETAYNRDGLALGRMDVPLTARGERQGAAVAARLANEPLTHVYSSPLVRCILTAQSIVDGRGVPLECRDELVELDVGESEGLTFPVMRERYAAFLTEWAGPDGHNARMPGGERLADVDARLAPFLDDLRRRRPHEAVAIVAHNFVIRIALTRLLGLELAAFRSIHIDVASLTTLRIRDDGSVLVKSLNDHCYTDGLEP